MSARTRGTECKTGQATRARHNRQILERWGPYCWICILAGRGLWRSRINLRLRWPHPRCFTRDHVVPRAHGGTDELGNLRAAHNQCNMSRGAKIL